jgi:hypothetical protein
MKTALIQQFSHTWRVFERLAGDFDARAWLPHRARGHDPGAAVLPHLAVGQLLHAVRRSRPLCLGKTFNADWAAVDERGLPSQADVAASIGEMEARTSNGCLKWTWRARTRTSPGRVEPGRRGAVLAAPHALPPGRVERMLKREQAGIVEDHYVKAI